MQNRLLSSLLPEELEHLHPHLELVSLSHAQQIIVPEVTIREIYFPLNCLLSLVTLLEDGSTVESGIIGLEGMAGVPVLLDARETAMPTYTQSDAGVSGDDAVGQAARGLCGGRSVTGEEPD
jgi:hypothetical protein